MVLLVNEFYKRPLTDEELKQLEEETKEFVKSLLDEEN